MPVIVAIITPKPDKFDAIESLITELAPAVHQEDGCELYALLRGQDRMVLIEKWRDAAALGAHGSGPNLKAMTEQLKDLVASPPEGLFLEPVPAGEGAKGAIGAS